MVEQVMMSTKWPPFMVQNLNLQKGQRKVKVKTVALVHNFIIIANGWNHDRKSISNMSSGIHKVVCNCSGWTDGLTDGYAGRQ